MSSIPRYELILIEPGEYTKRGYVFRESAEICLMFVLPGYQWPEGKEPPAPQPPAQVPYWSVATLEKASAFADAFPATRLNVDLPANPLPQG
jgi:hypothetical protein